MRIEFEWDPEKAASNAAKHGVRFETAMTVFRDPLVSRFRSSHQFCSTLVLRTSESKDTSNLLI
jgi:uncharacterized DUF497 family protein